jgi:DNA-binding XRE family transcriptional regulator
VALLVYRRIREAFEIVNIAKIHDSEGHVGNFWHDYDRDVSLLQATQVNTPAQKFGSQVRILRLQSGWTQSQLAEKAGIGRPYLSQIEHGKRSPGRRTKHRLVTLLEVQPPK